MKDQKNFLNYLGVMLLFAIAVLLVGMNRVRQSPFTPQEDLDLDNIVCALIHIEDCRDDALTPTQAGELLALLLPMEEPVAKMDRARTRINLTLSLKQKEFIIKDWENPLPKEYKPGAGWIRKVASRIEKSAESGREAENVISGSSRPGWPGREPSLNDLAVGIHRLQKAGMIKPSQRKDLTDSLNALAAGMEQMDALKKDIRDDAAKILTEKQIKQLKKIKVRPGEDYLLNHYPALTSFLRLKTDSDKRE